MARIEALIRRTRRHGRLALAAAMFCAQGVAGVSAAHAQATAPVSAEADALTDDWVYRLANRDVLAQMKVRYAVLGDPAIAGLFGEPGFAAACTALIETDDDIWPAYSQRFRPLVIAAMREKVPAERMRMARGLGLLQEAPLLYYRSRVEEALAAGGAPLFAEAEAAFRARFAERRAAAGARTDLPAPIEKRKRLWQGPGPSGISLNCAQYKAANRGYFTPRAAPTGE